LDGLATGKVVSVLANDGPALNETNSAAADSSTTNLDLAHLTTVSLSVLWPWPPTDLTYVRVDLVPPDDSILKSREALRARLVREVETKRKAVEAEAKRRADMLATGASHPANGASVQNVGAVATDILGIEMHEKEFQRGNMIPYVAQPDDTRTGGKPQWVVRDGKMLQETLGQTIQRKDEKGKLQPLGVISPDGKWVQIPPRAVGADLEKSTLEAPAAYEIQSSDDPAFATPVKPVAVYRKSKPNSPLTNGTLLHRLYLKLPAALKEGATYTVRFKAINTREETVAYKHDTRVVRSDAVHVTQVGYRPDDPFKRGYLSIWLGTGGSYAYTNLTTFELVDAQSGKTVFTGRPELAQTNLAVNELQKTDYAMTPAYWLDFSSFHTPGTYRVRVPGVGVSYPFPLVDTAWEVAFKIGMRGMMAQRSSIELGPPVIDYKRPRCYHPADGVKFYQLDGDHTIGEEGGRGEALLRLWKTNGKLEEVTGIWGGYADAGDFDVTGSSSAATDEIIEAYEINVDYAKQVKIAIPKEEAENKIPHLLNAALWGLSCMKRLQLPNGGVRDGYGDGWGVRSGECSWLNSNPVCVWAASSWNTWYYASMAARMARLLAPYDAAQAREYGESAVRAWKWAEAQIPPTNAPTAENRKDTKWLAQHAVEAAAAVALYQYTREPAYHERFKQLCEIQDARDTHYNGGWIEPMQQSDADFIYARLPDDLADATLKAHAQDRYVLGGKVAIYFMQHNAFNLVTMLPGIPMVDWCTAFFTNPGMGIQVVRAHVLTHDPHILEAIVASTGFGLGANPDNMAFTTGLGINPIRFPLKHDCSVTGQPAPVGITVLGPSWQRSGGWSGWVHTWNLTPTRMVPGSFTWPPPESYVDISGWPQACEFDVNRPLMSAAYVWCYLAARP